MLAPQLVRSLFIVAGLAACGAAGQSPAPATNCVADSIRTLRTIAGEIPECEIDSERCRDACIAGDALSCLGGAYLIETMPEKEGEAALLFHRGCILGSANACTNYAAHVWAHDPTSEQLACARRVFEKACEAREPFACGMSARIAFAEPESPTEFENARRELEASCKELGGFPCRVLAKHLEAGDLGPHDPARIGLLLEQACRGGDSDACGNPSTAAETFR